MSFELYNFNRSNYGIQTHTYCVLCITMAFSLDNTENYGSILDLINSHFELMTMSSHIHVTLYNSMSVYKYTCSLQWWHWTQTNEKNNNNSEWIQRKWSMNRERDEPNTVQNPSIFYQLSSFWVYLYSGIIITMNNIHTYIVQNVPFYLMKWVQKKRVHINKMKLKKTKQ